MLRRGNSWRSAGASCPTVTSADWGNFVTAPGSSNWTTRSTRQSPGLLRSARERRPCIWEEPLRKSRLPKRPFVAGNVRNGLSSYSRSQACLILRARLRVSTPLGVLPRSEWIENRYARKNRRSNRAFRPGISPDHLGAPSVFSERSGKHEREPRRRRHQRGDRRPAPDAVSSDAISLCDFRTQHLHLFVLDTTWWRGARNVRVSCREDGAGEIAKMSAAKSRAAPGSYGNGFVTQRKSFSTLFSRLVAGSQRRTAPA